MANKLTKKEQLQREQKRQLKRIEKRLAELERQGYITGYARTRIKKAKNPTQKTIDNLKKITPKFLKERSGRVDLGTGEIFEPKNRSAKKYYRTKIEHPVENATTGQQSWGFPSLAEAGEPMPEFDLSQALEEDAAADLIISNFYGEIAGFPDAWYSRARQLWDDSIDFYGKPAVAQAIVNMPQDFAQFVKQNKYDSSSYVDEYHSVFLEYLDISAEEKWKLGDEQA